MTTQPETHADNYTNAVSGMGGPVDKSVYTTVGSVTPLDRTILDRLYSSDGIAIRLVDRVVDESSRRKFRITDPTNYDWTGVLADLDELEFHTKAPHAWKMNRLYGGALLVGALQDSGDAGEELNEDALKGVLELEVLDRTSLMPVIPYSSSPDAYQIMDFDRAKGKAMAGRTIHSSRTHRLVHAEGSPRVAMLFDGWGPSALQPAWGPLKAVHSAAQYMGAVGHEQIITVMKVKGFTQLLRSGADGQRTIARMGETQRMGRDVHHMHMMDSEDSIEEVTKDPAGLATLFDKAIDSLVYAVPEPRAVVLGESPTGLNASSEGEVLQWYAYVDAEARRNFVPMADTVIGWILAVRRNRGEDVPETWMVELESLWAPTPSEKADTDLKHIQSAQILSALAGRDSAIQYLEERGVIPKAPTTAASQQVTAGPDANQVGTPEDDAVVAEELSPEAPASVEPIPPDLVSVQAAATAVGIPTRTLTRLMEKGLIRYWAWGSKRQVSMAEVMKQGAAARVSPDGTPTAGDAE